MAPGRCKRRLANPGLAIFADWVGHADPVAFLHRVELSNYPVFDDSADFAGFVLTVANYFDDIAGEPVILDRRASFF